MTRDELIAAMRITANEKPIAIKIDGWPELYVRSLTVAEVEAQADDLADTKDKNRIARGVARIICDANGKRVFDPNAEADIKLLSAQPWKLLQKVMEAVKEPDSGN